MQINKTGENHHHLISLTSLEEKEFYAVLQVFDQVWTQYYQWHDLKGKKRKIPKYQEHSDISLKGSYKKLLFILM